MISNRRFAMLTVGVLLCTPTVANAAEPEAAEDVLSLYQDKVHACATGVYEHQGWVFFHDRTKLTDDSMFGEVKAQSKAIGRIRKALFAKLDEMTGVSPAPDEIHTDLRTRAARNGSPKTVVLRSVDELPTRVLQQASSDGDYVYDMAVKRRDLEAEAAKGRFEDRPQTIEAYWRNVVREQLYGKNRMSFIRDCGAIDLWTLESAKTCGVKELRTTNGNEIACCQECLIDLSKSASHAKVPAADEYVKLTAGLYKTLVREMATIPELTTNRIVRTMVLSFGCCAQSPEKERGADLDIVADYIDQTEPATNTVTVLARLLSHTPGSVLYWGAMGVAAQRAEMPHVALACHRNVLRMKANDAVALGCLAETYDSLGLHSLAHGAALLAFAESTDADLVERMRKIFAKK